MGSQLSLCSPFHIKNKLFFLFFYKKTLLWKHRPASAWDPAAAGAELARGGPGRGHVADDAAQEAAWREGSPRRRRRRGARDRAEARSRPAGSLISWKWRCGRREERESAILREGELIPSLIDRPRPRKPQPPPPPPPPWGFPRGRPVRELLRSAQAEAVRLVLGPFVFFRTISLFSRVLCGPHCN